MSGTITHGLFKLRWRCTCSGWSETIQWRKWLLGHFHGSKWSSDWNLGNIQCCGHFKFWRDFQLHQNVAGHGTTQQSRPMCPHIRRALPTTHILFNSVLTCWDWDSLLNFVEVWLTHKLRTQGFLTSELLRESSLRSCVGQLGTLVCNYTVHFLLHIVRCWNRINSQHYQEVW